MNETILEKISKKLRLLYLELKYEMVFQERLWGYYEKGVFDPWRVKGKTQGETIGLLGEPHPVSTKEFREFLKTGIKEKLQTQTQGEGCWLYCWLLGKGYSETKESPPSLENRVRYDPCRSHVVFQGAMTEGMCKELKKYRKDDANYGNYEAAISQIHRKFENARFVELDLTIIVKDLKGFTDYPDKYPAEVEGKVHYDGIEYDIKSGEKSTFKLFTRDEDTGVRRMEYDIPFFMGKQEYLLHGYKNIADDPMKIDLMEMLQDISTLYISIYEGSVDGKMLGTGIVEYHLEVHKLLLGILPKPWSLHCTRKRRRKFIEYFVKNLRESYSFLEPIAPQKIVASLVYDLDRAWFGFSWALFFGTIGFYIWPWCVPPLVAIALYCILY